MEINEYGLFLEDNNSYLYDLSEALSFKLSNYGEIPPYYELTILQHGIPLLWTYYHEDLNGVRLVLAKPNPEINPHWPVNQVSRLLKGGHKQITKTFYLDDNFRSITVQMLVNWIYHFHHNQSLLPLVEKTPLGDPAKPPPFLLDGIYEPMIG